MVNQGQPPWHDPPAGRESPDSIDVPSISDIVTHVFAMLITTLLSAMPSDRPLASIRSQAWPLAFTLLLSVATGGCSRQPVESAATADSDSSAEVASGPVEVIIRSADGEFRHRFEDVAAGTTLAEVMSRVDEPVVKIVGSGATTFVESIGESGTTGGTGWSYSVDGEWGDRSIGVYPLTPPAEVVWTHGTFAENAP